MKRILQSKIEFLCHALATLVCIIASCALAYSLWSNIENTHDGTALFMTIIVAVFTLSVWTITLFSLFKTLTRPFMDDNGVGLTRFSRTVVYIKWEEIIDMGKGKALTLRGAKDMVYISKKLLQEDQKENLDVLRDGVVCFSKMSDEIMNEIFSHCPKAELVSGFIETT